MKALRILHSSQRRPNILKYIDQLPNLEELYLPNFHLTQKFLDELPKNLEVLICNRIDFNKGFIDLSRFRNLRKLGNILRAPKDFISNLFKLEEVVSHVELDLPKSITSFNGPKSKHHKFYNINFFENCNIVSLKYINTSQDLNFLCNSLEYFKGNIIYIDRISKCKKLKHLNLNYSNNISFEDVNIDFPNLEYLKIRDASKFISSTKIETLICKNKNMNFIEYLPNLKHLECYGFYGINQEINLEYLRVSEITYKSLDCINLVNVNYISIHIFRNKNIDNKWNKFPYTKKEFPIFANTKILQIDVLNSGIFLSFPFENFPNLEILYVKNIHKYMSSKPKKFKIKKY